MTNDDMVVFLLEKVKSMRSAYFFSNSFINYVLSKFIYFISVRNDHNGHLKTEFEGIRVNERKLT